MDELIAFLAQLHDRPAEIRSCYGLPTDAADTCRELVIRSDHQESHHPKHDPIDEPLRITTAITPNTGSLSLAGIAPTTLIR